LLGLFSNHPLLRLSFESLLCTIIKITLAIEQSLARCPTFVNKQMEKRVVSSALKIMIKSEELHYASCESLQYVHPVLLE